MIVSWNHLTEELSFSDGKIISVLGIFVNQSGEASIGSDQKFVW